MHPLLEKGNEWQLVEEGINKSEMLNNETLFTLANGYVGTRGSLEEGYRHPQYVHNDATYLNGFFETSPIQYGEWAYGYAKKHQTICSLPSSHHFAFAVDDEWFDLEKGQTTNHKRVLDLKKGILTRTFEWENSRGKKVAVAIERFVSFHYPELVAMRVEITAITNDMNVTIEQHIGTIELESTDSNDPRVAKKSKKQFTTETSYHNGDVIKKIQTKESQLHAHVGVATESSKGSFVRQDDNHRQLSMVLRNQENMVVHQFAVYKRGFEENAIERLDEMKSIGFDTIRAQHIADMEKFWQKADIQIEGDPELQKGVRFSIFHLNQAAGRDGKTNIAAKGLTGDGYEGHYFWDTEMYMFPFFLYTQPDVARQLLLYRYSILPKAKERARKMGVNHGILFPWRTISGEEASAYYPAGTAQFHINADVAHATHSYIQVTEDQVFANNEGLEILVETARFWLTFGHFDSNRENQFVINGVTGPDEYTAIVNNNFYTNYMAKHNFLYAVRAVRKIMDNGQRQGIQTLQKLAFKESEAVMWEKAANAMFLPYDEEQGVTMQDDSMKSKKVWDFANTPKEKHPLLLHYHPLTIYRYQVNKQADTVLAEFLFSDEFSMEQKQRDYDYYEKITTHDSSLSKSIFGIMASELGRPEKAYTYFMDTALMDISNLQSNTKDGLHLANIGGTWMSLIFGFSGMRVMDGVLHFTPKIPKQWDAVSFSILFKNRRIQVKLSHDKNSFDLLEGHPVSIKENGKTINLVER